MPLLKITDSARKRKIFCSADTLEQLISDTKNAFELPDVDEGYKIVLEEDGTAIPNTEVLIALATEIKGDKFLLMILPKNHDWVAFDIDVSLLQLNNSMVDLATGGNQVEEINAGSELSSVEASSDPNSASSANLPLVVDEGASTSRCDDVQTLARKVAKPFPWNKFPSELIQDCESCSAPTPFDKRVMVQVVAQYLVDDCNSIDLQSARSAATKIVQKYPYSFVSKIGDGVADDGVKKLTSDIYNRMFYYRCIRDGSKGPSNDDSENKLKKTKSKNSRCAASSYGCVAYDPSLSDDENEKTQQEKKAILLEQAELLPKDRDDVKILDLLQKTYPSQRITFNDSTLSIEQMLKQWPLLKENLHFFQHTSKLLAISVDEVWQASLKKYQPVMIEYFKFYVKNSKVKDTTQLQEMKNILEKLEEAIKVAENNIPFYMAIFSLITLYFKESESLLYIMTDTDEFKQGENLDSVPTSPILLISGESLFDQTSKYAVAIEKKIHYIPATLTDGMLITFLCYYMFGLEYPENLGKTLEFIQRVFMNINPATKLTKRGGKKKGSTSGYSLPVKGLFDKLQKFM